MGTGDRRRGAWLRSVVLWAELAELPEYAAATTVMAFASMPSEPDTDGLILFGGATRERPDWTHGRGDEH